MMKKLVFTMAFAILSTVSFAQEKASKADVVLLGPQIKYALPEVKKIADEHGKKIEAINMVDYGMMNGKKVLDQALALIG